MKRQLTVLLLLAATPAFAQRFEIAPFAGYTSAGGIDQKARGIEDLKIEGGFTWGGAATFFISDHLGGEVLFARQESALGLSTADGSAELFDLNLSQLQGSFV